MVDRFRWLVAAAERIFSSFVLASSAAVAAEIHSDAGADAARSIVLEGNIEAGDLEKLQKSLFDGNLKTNLFIASPGGDLVEAMKIGRFVRASKLTVTIPSLKVKQMNSNKLSRGGPFQHELRDFDSNYKCTSACFFVFVAGIWRDSDMNGLSPPLLGVHRPYMDETQLRELGIDKAISSVVAMRNTVERYLREMDVPVKYSELMFSVPKDEIRWITQEEQEADFSGIIPGLKDWADARCNKLTSAEKNIRHALPKYRDQMSPAEVVMDKMILEKLLDQDRCERKLAFDLAVDGLTTQFLKMRSPANGLQ